jgi:hypothetical protein
MDVRREIPQTILTRFLQLLFWISTISAQGVIPFFRGWSISEVSDEEIVKNLSLGHSMIRWGDGETANLRLKSTFHQKSSSELSRELNYLLDQVLSNSSLMFGLPILGLQYPIVGNKNFSYSLLKIYFSTRVLFNQRRFLQFKKFPVIDQMFWYKNYSKITEILSRVDFQERSVLFISSHDEKEFFKGCKDFTFVKVAPIDSFNYHNLLISQVTLWIDNSKQKPLLLLAGGAASKVVGARFLEKCQVIDIGSGIRFNRIGGVKYDWDE